MTRARDSAHGLGGGRLRLKVRNSLMVVPGIYLVLAVILGFVAPALDKSRDSSFLLDEGTAAAQDILTSTATGMIAFTGFVLAGVLVVVQFAAGQYSPRLVLWFRRDRLIKHAIGCFLAAFLYSLVALSALERNEAKFAPDLTVGVALLLLAGSAVLFTALLERVIDHLRPRRLYGAVSRDGIAAVHHVYPHSLDEGTVSRRERSWVNADPVVVRVGEERGVIVSFDRRALFEAARGAGATIELVPAVGESVRPGGELLLVHGGSGVKSAHLRHFVVISEERTIDQDPAFAIRIIVDTAIRALSPAVNDPTTGTQGLDALEPLVREFADRDLDASFESDESGAVRLVWRTPNWDDVLDLSFDEIRAYGGSSLQICRRLRAVLEDLLTDTPEIRHDAIREHLRRLDFAVQHAFLEGSPERELARTADRIGLGLSRSPRTATPDGLHG